MRTEREQAYRDAECARLRVVIGHVAAALEADGRTADGCTKADAAARLRAALLEAKGLDDRWPA